jgi:homeobox-leucine zipper protein
MQTQQELHQNDLLRDENEKLRAENEIYKGALKDSLCPNCTDPISIGEMSSNDNQLRIENARLKVEVYMLLNCLFIVAIIKQFIFLII